MRIIITGATGAAGLATYRAALSDPSVSHITLLARRPLPDWAILPPSAASKTTTVLHQDFGTYPEDLARRLAEHDACIWTIGTASNMSETDYTRVNHDYVLAAAKAVGEARKEEGREGIFRFVYMSVEGTDPRGQSRVMFARVKGRTETDLIEYCKSVPGMKGRIYQPGYFFPSARYPEDKKYQRTATQRMMDHLMAPVFRAVMPSILSPIDDLARFHIELAKGTWPDTDVFSNKDMRELVKQL